MKLRIFILSVQKEFAEERRLSWGAVRAQSPREKCLFLLAESELKRKEIAIGVRM